MTEAIGKTRGGFNTNIVMAVNQAGRPVDWLLLAGNVPESKATSELLAGLHPDLVVADKIHDTDDVRKMLEDRGIEGAIPNHPRRKRCYPWHPAIKLQHVVDNYFAKLKQYRRVATRYDKTAESYGAVVALGVLWIALQEDYPARTDVAHQRSDSSSAQDRAGKLAGGCLNCPIPEYWPRVTDEQWARVAPLLPQGTGRRAEATRRQFDVMLYALESGCPWRLLPPQFGPPGTVETRFRRWAADGVLRRAYAALYPPEALAKGRTVIIGGSYAKVHKSAAGSRARRSGRRCLLWCLEQCPRNRPAYCPDRQAIAKTRGGFNTKIVIVVNEAGQLVDWRLLAGTVPESEATLELLVGLHPAVVVAGANHDKRAIRNKLELWGIEGAILNQPRRKRRHPWHPAMKLLHVVDGYLARLLQYRRVATRYDKTAESYGAVVALGVLWIALQEDYPARTDVAHQRSDSSSAQDRAGKLAGGCLNCPIPEYWPRVTDEQWARVAPLLPQGTGRRAEATRRQFDVMLYALESGCPWRLLPPQFGPPGTVETRFRRWAADGVLRRAYAALYPPEALAKGRTVIIGGSYAKVHKSAAGSRARRSGRRCLLWCLEQCPRNRPAYCPDRQAIAKTRGGFNTKIVIVVNEAGQLVDWRLLAGTVPESEATLELLVGLHPAVVVAGANHDKRAIRNKLELWGIEGAILNQPRRKRRHPWHPAMKLLHVVDGYLARLLQYRRVATRYDKTVESYDAVIALAALWIGLQRDCPGRSDI